MYYKNVRYDYFTVGGSIYNKETDSVRLIKEYDISTIFEKLKPLKPQNIAKPFRGESARIQKIVKYDKDIWQLQLLRLRENTPPGIATESGDFELIKLEDGQYIAEYTSAIYDQSNRVLVMHRNRNAFSPNGVAEFLSSYINNGDQIRLNPILAGTNIERIMKAKYYRKINISVDGRNLSTFKSNPGLGRILKEAEKFDGNVVQITIGLGRSKKKDSLDNSLVQNIIEEAYISNDDNVDEINESIKRFKIDFIENEDTAVEAIDLIDDRRSDFQKFPVSRDAPLTYNAVSNQLLSTYLKRKRENKINK